MKSKGSPPPMRGKVAQFMKSEYHIRITPAYAGKRQTRAPCGLYGRDHPRLCGEKPEIPLTRHVELGSPPPMRGKGHYWIPESKLEKDHPRLCGEKCKGSVEKKIYAGITPAYAGKSCPNSPKSRFVTDHPRLCGEKFNCFTKFRRRLGSPPPMRGKVFKLHMSFLPIRITPAYAGKSCPTFQ